MLILVNIQSAFVFPFLNIHALLDSVRIMGDAGRLEQSEPCPTGEQGKTGHAV